MSSNPLMSKEVKFKKVLKVLAIALPVVIIFVICNNHFNLIDGSFGRKYQTKKVEKENVLGKEITDLSDSEADYTEWFYNEANRVVGNYDFDGKEIKPLIQIPTYKFVANKDIYEESYNLSSSDIISVSCNKLKSEASSEYEVYDVHFCNVLLNSKEVFTAWSWTDNIEISPHITIFDNEDLEYPLIVVGEEFGSGSRDNVSVYKVVDKELVQFTYNDNGEISKTRYVDPYVKIYVKDNQEYVITYFHDPAMSAKSLTRIWKVEGSNLNLVETILEKGEASSLLY